MYKTCCFTGHRIIPEKEESEIKKHLESEIINLFHQGVTTFLNGGASGFDMLAAEKVLSLRTFCGLPIKLIMVPPCKDQDKYWSQDNKIRLMDILNNSNEIIYLSEKYYEGCMQKRNRYLVDNSGTCICYLIKTAGDTAYTTAYAKEKGLKIINVAFN